MVCDGRAVRAGADRGALGVARSLVVANNAKLATLCVISTHDSTDIHRTVGHGRADCSQVHVLVVL